MPVVLPYKIRQRKKLVFALALAAGVVVCIAVVLSNPLRRSPEGIEAWLKKQTPLGTSMEQVREFLIKKRWYDPNHLEEHPFDREDLIGHPVGVYSPHGYLGSYGTVIELSTYVEAFWGFDRDRKLVRIHVKKSVEGL